MSKHFFSAVSSRPGPREHIQCNEGDVGGYVLLPGDPGRVALIASRLHAPREIASNREFHTMSGTINGTLVTVTSTGIGGPSAAIAIEELAQLGAHTFIRIGTSGAMQRDLHIGDLVIATAAIRDEGTSNHYVPLAFPAVSDYRVVSSLVETATALGHSFQVGVVHSKDSFYGQHEAQRMPIAVELEQRWQTWIRAGALCSEMESAAVFSVAGAALGLRAGAVIAVAGNQESGEHLDDETALRHRDDGIKRAIECGIGAISRLIELDSIAQ